MIRSKREDTSSSLGSSKQLLLKLLLSLIIFCSLDVLIISNVIENKIVQKCGDQEVSLSVP